MANKYFEKAAGIGTALKAFAGHATGKTLHGAEIKEATRKGLVGSGAKTDVAVSIDKETRKAGKGPLFESTKGLETKKYLAQTTVAAGGGSAIGVAHAVGKRKGENKYLDKTAGVVKAIKAIKEFPGHLTGKTLANSHVTHAIGEAKRSAEIPEYHGTALSRAYKNLHEHHINTLAEKHNKAVSMTGKAGVGAVGATAAGLTALKIKNAGKKK